MLERWPRPLLIGNNGEQQLLQAAAVGKLPFSERELQVILAPSAASSCGALRRPLWATGVHRPLTATAMVFRAANAAAGDDTEQILVALDLCLLWAGEMNNLLGDASSANDPNTAALSAQIAADRDCAGANCP